jgi:hypothetical protein
MLTVYRDRLSGDILEADVLEVRDYMLPVDTYYLDDELPGSPMNGFFYASSFALIVNVDGVRVWVPVSEDMTLSPDYADAMQYQAEVEAMHKEGEAHCEELLRSGAPAWLDDYLAQIEDEGGVA